MPRPDNNGQRFSGFRRADGSVGVRNHLLVLSATGLTGPSARRIGGSIAGSVVVDMPYGSGHLGDDRRVQARVLTGIATNPNVGAAIVLAGDRPRGEAIGDALTGARRPCAVLVLDDHGHDALALTDAGLRAGARLAREMSRARREIAPLAALSLGLECGRSDPTSGLVANPVLGLVADRVVDAGGTAMFGETTEWLGAEHLLARRAASPEVGDAIVEAARARERLAVDGGIDLLGNNPGPTNIAAGLSTIEEKALGAIAKSGSRRIESVVGYGERPASPGLHAMDAPAYAPESITGFVAAGAQLLLFTTGVGNSYASALAPTVKVSANPVTAERLAEQIDFACPETIAGDGSLDAAAGRLAAHVLEIASGTLTFGEILGEGGTAFSRFGASL